MPPLFSHVYSLMADTYVAEHDLAELEGLFIDCVVVPIACHVPIVSAGDAREENSSLVTAFPAVAGATVRDRTSLLRYHEHYH